MWKQKAAQVIPVVISSTGVVPKSLSHSLTTLNMHPNTYISELRGLSPHANYTDRAAAAGRRS